MSEFSKLVKDTYRIKATGKQAYDDFKSSRQGKKTPRSYVLYLEDLATTTTADPEVEDITAEMVLYKFKTTIWTDIQDEIA